MATRDELVFSRMRRNVRKTVQLKFRYYELRIKAKIILGKEDIPYDVILPMIRLTYLRKVYVKRELYAELLKINGITGAEAMIEVFAVYGTKRALGEYKRYLGEFLYFISNLQSNEQTLCQHQHSAAYYEQPDKHNFIPERL